MRIRRSSVAKIGLKMADGQNRDVLIDNDSDDDDESWYGLTCLVEYDDKLHNHIHMFVQKRKSVQI